MDLFKLRSIASSIEYEDWVFAIWQDRTGTLLLIASSAPVTDNDNPDNQIVLKFCRVINTDAAEDSIVRSAHDMILEYQRHEISEKFKYKQVPIFHEHIPVNKLVKDFVQPEE